MLQAGAEVVRVLTPSALSLHPCSPSPTRVMVKAALFLAAAVALLPTGASSENKAARDSLTADNVSPLRTELDTIPKVSGLKKRARAAGIAEDAISEADDADSPREFLISLIVEEETAPPLSQQQQSQPQPPAPPSPTPQTTPPPTPPPPTPTISLPKYKRAHTRALTLDKFEEEVLTEQAALIKFYAPWCAHCKRIKAAFDVVANSYDGKYNVVRQPTNPSLSTPDSCDG